MLTIFSVIAITVSVNVVGFKLANFCFFFFLFVHPQVGRKYRDRVRTFSTLSDQ